MLNSPVHTFYFLTSSQIFFKAIQNNQYILKGQFVDSYDPTIEETFNKNIKIRNQVNIILVAKSTSNNLNVNGNSILIGAVIVLNAMAILSESKG